MTFWKRMRMARCIWTTASFMTSSRWQNLRRSGVALDVNRGRNPALRHSGMLVAALLLVLPLAAQTVAGTGAPQLFSDMKWRLIGPFRGGRAVAVGGVPGAGTTFYFGAVDGGVWKTTDAGTVWQPVFDHQPVASIGALEVSSAN